MHRPIAIFVSVLIGGLTTSCRGGGDDAARVSSVPRDVSVSTSSPVMDPAAPASLAPLDGAADTTSPQPGSTLSTPSTIVGTGSAPVLHTVATLEGSARDPLRDRLVPYVIYAPVGLDGDVPLILVSHGGNGNARGHLSAPHLGTTFAEGGFVAIHIGHRPSDAAAGQLSDRPADVTFVLDQLEAGAIEWPVGFDGTVDLDRIGHTGHSFGAYTSHAVGGATFAGERGAFDDERIEAIAPISPQGPDQMGAFDRGPTDNTWMTVTIPSYNLIGGAEVDSNAVDTVNRPGWRLAPFDRYPDVSDTFRSIIDDQGHSDMWRTGSTEVQEFVAGEILEFMQVYVAGDRAIDACGIGVGELSTVTLERHPAAVGSLIDTCV